MLLLMTSLAAGVLTPLAPCILPLLPVVLGTGTVLGRRSLFRIIGSLAVSTVIFTMILRVSTVFIEVPQSVWTSVSALIIGLIGLMLVVPQVWERLPLGSANARALRGLRASNSPSRDVALGAALGPVFTTCSPTYFLVLATVLPVDLVTGLIYLFAYTLGLSAMLLFIGVVGETAVRRLGSVSDPRGVWKRALGVLFIAVAVIVGLGYDKKIQLALLDAGFYDVTRIEQWLLGVRNEALPQMPAVIQDETLRIARKKELYRPAPEIVSPAGFINTPPITIEEFKGRKVILLDIWTYSCINCQRTIPYLNAWHTAYEDNGLVIIGIHTPEFAFEKDIDNVRWAVEQFGIAYPTVLDNEYATWKALGNNFWPRKYLIDIDGFIVYDHVGEGAYAETELAIQRALMERASILGDSLSTTGVVADGIAEDRQFRHSPELYFGAWRNDRLGNGVPHLTGARTYTLPAVRERDKIYLEGAWDIRDEYARASKGAKIHLKYTGREVFMVASGDAVVRVRSHAGEGAVTISQHRLYELISAETVGTHDLEIEIIEGTLDIYTVTFG